MSPFCNLYEHGLCFRKLLEKDLEIALYVLYKKDFSIPEIQYLMFLNEVLEALMILHSSFLATILT